MCCPRTRGTGSAGASRPTTTVCACPRLTATVTPAPKLPLAPAVQHPPLGHRYPTRRPRICVSDSRSPAASSAAAAEAAPPAAGLPPAAAAALAGAGAVAEPGLAAPAPAAADCPAPDPGCDLGTGVWVEPVCCQRVAPAAAKGSGAWAPGPPDRQPPAPAAMCRGAVNAAGNAGSAQPTGLTPLPCTKPFGGPNGDPHGRTAPAAAAAVREVAADSGPGPAGAPTSGDAQRQLSSAPARLTGCCSDGVWPYKQCRCAAVGSAVALLWLLPQ